MTKQEFYREFKKIAKKYKFRICKNNKIRGNYQHQNFCPITAVHNEKYGYISIRDISTALNRLQFNDIDILHAADTSNKKSGLPDRLQLEKIISESHSSLNT